jgi:hypothetical protein
VPGDVFALRRAWRQWTASLPSATVFFGLQASQNAAGGFIDDDTLASQVLLVEGAAYFGGVMLWSRSYDKDSGFSVKLQGILRDQNNQGTDCTVRSADESVTDCEHANYIRTFH